MRFNYEIQRNYSRQGKNTIKPCDCPRQTHEKNKWLKNFRFSVILKKNGGF